MSGILTRFLTDKCTIWRSSGEPNDFGQITYGAPEVISCGYVEGGKITTDATGNQFAPMATFWCKDTTIKRGDMVAYGEFTTALSDTAGAHKIRKVITGTPLRGSPDVSLLTG